MSEKKLNPLHARLLKLLGCFQRAGRGRLRARTGDIYPQRTRSTDQCDGQSSVQQRLGLQIFKRAVGKPVFHEHSVE